MQGFLQASYLVAALLKSEYTMRLLRRYKGSWLVKGEGKTGKVVGLIPSANKN